MPPSDDLTAIPENFAGKVRLFPLPDLVMFPHVMQPLHLFEPRYLEMLRDALADDQLIAMAVLKPGWQGEYHGRPPIESVACLGKVVTHVPTKSEGQNILLLGLQRVAIQRELPPVRSYRQAQVTLLSETYAAEGDANRGSLQRELLEAFRQFVPESATANEQFNQLMSSNISLGSLTDIVAFTLEMPLAEKQELLSELDVDRRATRLLSCLRRLASGGDTRPFPPEFSLN